ncbi:hypothetical protein D3C72_2186010 [compost metagenome]
MPSNSLRLVSSRFQNWCWISLSMAVFELLPAVVVLPVVVTELTMLTLERVLRAMLK